MAAERKSDFTGDRFGDWYVNARAKGIGDGKRRWHLTNTVTDETKIMLQTELQGLLKFTSNPEPVLEGLDDPFGMPDVVAGVGPGQCKHDVFLNDCPECSARMGTPLDDRGRATLTGTHPAPGEPVTVYVPQGQNALSAQISRSAMGILGEQMMFEEAVASVALSQDPDMQTYYVDTRRPVTIGTSESIGELGDMVREANAERDPLREALMTAMGALSEARDAIDQALKVAIQAGR